MSLEKELKELVGLTIVETADNSILLSDVTTIYGQVQCNEGGL